MALKPLLVLVLQVAKSFCWEALRSQPLAANGVQGVRANAGLSAAVFEPRFRSGPRFPRAVRPKKHEPACSPKYKRLGLLKTSGALEPVRRAVEDVPGLPGRGVAVLQMNGWVLVFSHTLIPLAQYITNPIRSEFALHYGLGQ